MGFMNAFGEGLAPGLPQDEQRRLLSQALLTFGQGALDGAATGDATRTTSGLNAALLGVNQGRQSLLDRAREDERLERQESRQIARDDLHRRSFESIEEDRSLAREDRSRQLSERESQIAENRDRARLLSERIREIVNDPSDPRSANAQLLAGLGDGASIDRLAGMLEAITGETLLPGQIATEAEARRNEVLNDIRSGASRNPNLPPPRNPSSAQQGVGRFTASGILSQLERRTRDLTGATEERMGLGLSDFQRTAAGLPPLTPEAREQLRLEAREKAMAAAKQEMSDLIGTPVEELLGRAAGASASSVTPGGAESPGADTNPPPGKIRRLDDVPVETIVTTMSQMLNSRQVSPADLRGLLENRIADPNKIEQVLQLLAPSMAAGP